MYQCLARVCVAMCVSKLFGSCAPGCPGTIYRIGYGLEKAHLYSIRLHDSHMILSDNVMFKWIHATVQCLTFVLSHAG